MGLFCRARPAGWNKTCVPERKQFLRGAVPLTRTCGVTLLTLPMPALRHRYDLSNILYRSLVVRKYMRWRSCVPVVLPSTGKFSPKKVTYSHAIFLNMQFNIILQPTCRFSKWYLSYRFLHQSPVCSSPLSSYYVPHSREFHSPLFDYPNNICWGADLMKLPITQFSVVHLLLRPSSTQTCFSEPYSRTP